MKTQNKKARVSMMDLWEIIESLMIFLIIGIILGFMLGRSI